MKEVTKFLWRGKRPRHYQDLKSAGFDTCLSLQSGAEDALTDSDLEHENPSKIGLDAYRLRCSNVFPPSKVDVMEFLVFVDRAATAKRKLYVYCHSGVDRTGYMIAVYRMRVQDWAFERAHAEWVREGRHWWFWWWKFSLKKWRGEYERRNDSVNA